MLHAAAAEGQRLDAFVVRKAQKAHGLQRLIEGSPVAGRRVLAVDDTSTTGGSVLTAVHALREPAPRWSGWRSSSIGTPGRGELEAAGLEYRWAVDAVDLGLAESNRPDPKRRAVSPIAGVASACGVLASLGQYSGPAG